MSANLARDRLGIVAAVIVLAGAFFIASAPQRKSAPESTSADAPTPNVTSIANAPERTRHVSRIDSNERETDLEPAAPDRRSHQQGERESPTAGSTQPPERATPAPAPQPERTPAPPTARVQDPSLALDEYFDIMNDDRRTHDQRVARIRPYSGTRLTWNGFVRQIRDGSDDARNARLLAISPSAEQSWDLALCWFDSTAGRELGRLQPGDRVTVTGTLDAPSGMGPVLRNCRLGGEAD